MASRGVIGPMPPLRVSIISPRYFDPASCLGGGERYAQNVALAMTRAAPGEFAIDLVSFGPAPFTRTISDQVTLRVLPHHGDDDVTRVFSWDLPDALSDADLVHCHAVASRSFEQSLLAAKIRRKPVIFTDHSGFTPLLARDAVFLNLVEQVVCYSEFGARLIRAMTSRPIEVIRGGVDTDFFRPSESKIVRDRVLYVGRILPHKGIDQLIDALPKDLPLTICGGVHRTDYLDFLQEKARGKQVQFIDDANDEQIRSLYQRAWATVLPSVYRDVYGGVAVAPELMGLTLLESMACGTPVVCSRVGGMPEFVTESGGGFVFDSLEQLTERLVVLAHDQAEVESLGRAARAASVRHYDLRVVGRKYAETYRAVATRTRSAA